jgi:hypothetical protein
MKARYTILLVMLAILASQKAKIGFAQDTSVNIPLRAGTFSVTGVGSLALCLNPAAGFAEVNCAAKGATAFPFTSLLVGTVVSNGQILCQTVASTFSTFPVDITPPSVATQHAAIKILDYDPHTGAGDSSFISYIGGHCNGAEFDKTGATELNHGTAHTASSENGNRVDIIITAIQDSLGGYADFSLSSVEHALVPTNP